MTEKEEVKEGFCGACASVPIALMGVGVSKVGKNTMRDKKKRGINLLAGFLGWIVSAAIAYFFLYVKECKECR